MAIILLPHQPIDFTYAENGSCENLSTQCLQYETGDNPMFQIKRSGNSVPLVVISGIDEEFTKSIPIYSQGSNFFTYELNFAELGITSGCFELCVYDAFQSSGNLVANGTFGSDLSGWTVADGIILGISNFINPTDDETCDGEVELFVTGGTAPYTYSMDGITYQSLETFTGLCYGEEYTFYVKDVYNMVEFIPFTFQDCSLFAGSEAFDIKDIISFEIKNCEAFDFV